MVTVFLTVVGSLTVRIARTPRDAFNLKFEALASIVLLLFFIVQAGLLTRTGSFNIPVRIAFDWALFLFHTAAVVRGGMMWRVMVDVARQAYPTAQTFFNKPSPLGSITSLAQVLASDDLRPRFRKHLANEYSLENLVFYLETEKLSNMVEEKRRLRRARWLLRRFVVDGAKYQVNLTAQHRDQAVQLFEESGDVSGIVNLGRVIYNLMEVDALPRFRCNMRK